MRRRIWVTMTAVMLAAVCATAQAAELDAKRVPSAAKWVLHVDFDTLRGSEMWAWIEPKLQADAKYAQAIKGVAAISGMRFPQDLNDATIYGTSADEKDNVVLITGKADQARIKQMLEAAPGYALLAHGEGEVLRWEDKGKVMFGAFASESRIVIGQNQQLVEQALDLSSGKGESLKEALPVGAGAGVMMTLNGTGLGELLKAKDPKSPMVGQLNSAWLELSEHAGHVTLKAKAQARDAETAGRIRTTLEGVKAFVGLVGTSEQADQKSKLAAAAADKAKVTNSGATVELDWKLPVAEVKALLEAADPRLAD